MVERARDRDTHEPIEEPHRAQANRIGALLAGTFPGMGFALLIFPFGGDDGRMNYISNADRPDMVKALEEFIQKNRAYMAPTKGKPQ